MQFLVVASAVLTVACAFPQYGYTTPDLPGSNQYGLPSNPQLGGQQGGNKYLPPATTTKAPLVHKQFYLVSPEEDLSREPRVKHLVLGRPQKNYRVVFIKAPGTDDGNVKYTAELAPKEEKTVIYVLSKKGEDLKPEDIETPEPTQPSKPEVFFIKYRSEEEASYAQREIQGQYDQLGGTNEFSNESSAPVTSIVGALDSLNADGSYNYKVISQNGSSSNNQSGGSGNVGSVGSGGSGSIGSIGSGGSGNGNGNGSGNGADILTAPVNTQYLPAA